MVLRLEDLLKLAFDGVGALEDQNRRFSERPQMRGLEQRSVRGPRRNSRRSRWSEGAVVRRYPKPSADGPTP